MLRTTIVDSGLGLTVFSIFKKRDEDANVTNAALQAVCNIVIDFSPLRPVRLHITMLFEYRADESEDLPGARSHGSTVGLITD